MQRLLQVVLSAWREAERVATERAEGSQEHKAALVAAERLRGLYRELVESPKADNDVKALESASPRKASDRVDNPVRFAIGALLAIVAASLLISSVGKPPNWNPTFFGLRPQGLGGRDRIRIYAGVALVAGILLAVLLGIR